MILIALPSKRFKCVHISLVTWQFYGSQFFEFPPDMTDDEIFEYTSFICISII